jgi:hypothetical protein
MRDRAARLCQVSSPLVETASARGSVESDRPPPPRASSRGAPAPGSRRSGLSRRRMFATRNRCVRNGSGRTVNGCIPRYLVGTGCVLSGCSRGMRSAPVPWQARRSPGDSTYRRVSTDQDDPLIRMPSPAPPPTLDRWLLLQDLIAVIGPRRKRWDIPRDQSAVPYRGCDRRIPPATRERSQARHVPPPTPHPAPNRHTCGKGMGRCTITCTYRLSDPRQPELSSAERSLVIAQLSQAPRGHSPGRTASASVVHPCGVCSDHRFASPGPVQPTASEGGAVRRCGPTTGRA